MESFPLSWKNAGNKAARLLRGGHRAATSHAEPLSRGGQAGRGGLAGPPGARPCLSSPARGAARAARGSSPQAFPRGGWLDEGGSQARVRAGPHCPCLSRAPGSGAAARPSAQGPRHFSPAHYSALLQQASTPARAPPGPGNSRPSLREAVLLEGLGGANRSDMGMNLSGSWQQGHSATYNAPSRI